MLVVPFAHRAPGPDAQAAAFASHRASPAPALLPHEFGLRPTPTQPLYSDAFSEPSAPQTAPSLGAYTDVAMGGTAADERVVTATPFAVAAAGRPSEQPQPLGFGLVVDDEPQLEHPYSSVKRLGSSEPLGPPPPPSPAPLDQQLAPTSALASAGAGIGGPPATFTVRVSRGVTGLGFRVVGGADHGFPATVASVTKGALLCSALLCSPLLSSLRTRPIVITLTLPAVLLLLFPITHLVK